MAWIGMFDPATLEVTPMAWAGPGAGAGEYLAGTRTSIEADQAEGQGVLAQAIRTRKPVFDNDMSANPRVGGARRQEAVRRGYRSVVILPLIVDGNVAGNLSLFAMEKNFFNDMELKLLNELAMDISFALEHIAGQQRIEKLSRVRAVSSEINAAIVRARNRQGLFHEACRIAVEHGKFGIAWIGEFNPETLEITPVASAGLEEDAFLTHNKLVIRHDTPQKQSLIAGAIRERRAAYNNDIVVDAEVGGERRKEAIRRGYRSAIALPLIVEGAVTGTFSLFVKEANFFDDEEVGLLTELANNISFALEHMARQEKIEKLSRIRAVSSEINAAIARVRNRQELLDAACRIAVEQGQMGSAWIGSLDSKTLDITPVAWAGEGSEEMRTTVSTARDDPPRGQGAVSRAVRERRAIFNNNLSLQSYGGPRRDAVLKLGFNSMIALPLFEGDTVVGTFTLYAREPGFFDDSEIALLTELAADVSFALESIARQQKIEKLSRIRAISSGVNAAIVRIRERKALLEETCRIASEQGKFAMVWIGTIDQEKQEVVPIAWTEFTPQAAQGVSWKSMSAARGTLSEAILTRKPSVRDDIESELPVGGLRGEALKRGCRSTVALPIVVDDRVEALVVLFAVGLGFFDSDELALLEEVAADISFALHTIDRQERLDYLSYYDTLTGLPNRALFVDRVGQQMRSRDSEPLMVALVLLNLERFRNINETFGRHGGDDLLKQVARRMEDAFHGKDYLGRIGADGFGVVLRGIRNASSAVHAVEDQILRCFHEPFKLTGTELRVAARAGIALYPVDGGDADTLFKNAEAALKNTRGAGERYLFYSADLNARAASLLSLETRLRKAVEAQQFVLHYQPKIELAREKICGLEALIRWQDPGAGLVAPGTFIPLLEETGLILEVGKWALIRALAQHREWTARGVPAPRIAVNVSAIQLQRRDFADVVTDVLRQKGDSPDALELEITESMLMKDVNASIEKLSILRGKGIHIALDDFGTGYSSLSYIARLPINSVKIDRSFISGMAGNPQDMSIVSTIIALAHSLNLRVVAEGVETEDQSKLLKLLKCDEAQGYLFGKPLPPENIEALLRVG
jgi:diguanylate cyclase (GGDEF)-like protein